jgi:hypothetical protein
MSPKIFLGLGIFSALIGVTSIVCAFVATDAFVATTSVVNAFTCGMLAVSFVVTWRQESGSA